MTDSDFERVCAAYFVGATDSPLQKGWAITKHLTPEAAARHRRGMAAALREAHRLAEYPETMLEIDELLRQYAEQEQEAAQ